MNSQVSPKPRVVLHLGPSLEERGGIASVIDEYVVADLRPWRIAAVSTYTSRSVLARAVALVRATFAVLLASKEVAGVHLHVSHRFDLFRSIWLLQVARLRCLPAIVTVHGSRFVESALRHPRVVGAIGRRSRVVMTLDATRVDTLRSLGVTHVRLVPNPITVPEDWSIESMLGRERRVLFAGEIGTRKGVDVLLNAWPSVTRSVSEAALTLMGPLSEPDLVKELPASANYAGSVSRAAVRQELTRSAIAVLPSRAEAMPMFVLEAMAAGVPVVTTRVGALEELVGTHAGRVVPVGDSSALAHAIVELLTDRAAASAAGAGAREWIARRFAADVVFEVVKAEYERAFSRER